MNTLGAVILGALPLLMTTAAFGQEQSREFTGSSQITGSWPTGTDTRQDVQQTPPLFTIGKMPVRVWAPVPPPYSADANRNFAADPIGSG
jgi:hypothetical protein